MDDPFTMDDSNSVDNQTLQICENISYSDIANKLLKDKFYLTALELHTELIESGKEVQKLKEFFSNPGNFENQGYRQDVCQLPRSSSQATLDSLDMTRYSEDGERGVDERVAVLEFELRKAKETISALRANLTVATECETPTTESGGSFKPLHCETIKPHEQRALNFLLNEYLLLHGYKLTSITFADENEHQDFEDWDDVGLNIPKPPELLQLYRDALRQPANCNLTKQDVSSQTDSFVELLVQETEKLNEKILFLQNENRNLNSNIERLSCIEPVTTHFAMAPTNTESVSVHSATPECFEIIEPSPAPTSRHTSDCGSGIDRGLLLDDTSSLNDPDWTRVNAFNDSENGSAIETEGSRDDQVIDVESAPMEVLNNVVNSNRTLPPMFQREVVSRCFIQTSRLHEVPLLHEICSEGITQHRLVYILVQCLPRIIPSVLANKREELIPLLICTIHLHDESRERETLLHWLFNLKKRPKEDERRCILAGMVGLARVSTQAMIESELLPQCWEQISHRYVERRLLVAEACSALSPYVSAGLRNSLLLSILQQLYGEDREDSVRLSCIKSLALIVAVMADTDKYSQVEELTLTTLQDSSPTVVEMVISTLLPVLAKWTLDLGKLQSHLYTKMLVLLEVLLKRGMESSASSLNRPSIHQATMVLAALRSLLPYLVMSVASVECVLARIEPGLPLAEPRTGFADLCRGLTNPSVFYDGEHSVGIVMGAFDTLAKEKNWAELTWIIDTVIQRMLDNLEYISISDEDLLSGFVAFFKSLSAGFGRTVTLDKIKPVFLERLQRLESALANIGNKWPSFAIIPVYLLAIIVPIQSEVAEVGNTLRRFLCALALSNAPLDALQISVTHLSKITILHETLMAALWEGVVHPRPVVRCATAKLFSYAITHVGESMTTNRIVPALITLANDPEMTVKTATIPVFGTLIVNSTNKEVEDKTYFQLQNFLSDPSARDNHPTLLQLVVTLGQIVTKSDAWFRDEVVVPQLAATAAYTQQLTNQTRKLDLAAALVDAFSNTIYCSLSKNTITTALIPGLKYLEQVCLQSLNEHHETVISMIKEAESRSELPKQMERSGSITLGLATSNVGQGVEDMKNRVTKIFQTPMSRPTNLPNLQSIFRKK